MSYGKVHNAYWESETIDELSDRAALLGLFLISGPHRNAIGCFRLGIGAITDQPRFGAWGIEGVSKALQEFTDRGFIVRDNRTGWTYVVNALKHDPIKGFKAAAHAVALALSIPENLTFSASLRAKIAAQVEAVKAEAVAKKLEWKEIKGFPFDPPSIAHPTVIAEPCNEDRSPLPSPQPSPSPQPEPEPRGEAAKMPRPDLQSAVDAWNELADEKKLAKAQVLTSKRARSLSRRLDTCGGLGGWSVILAKIRGSPGLQGKDGGWKADFDFVISESGFTKIMEGKYDGWGTGKGSKPSGLDNGFLELVTGGGDPG